MEFVSKAPEVTKMRIVHNQQEMQSAPAFAPLFMHQFFGDEQLIQGYKGLELNFYIAASTARLLCEFHFAEKTDKAVDIKKALLDVIGPCEMTTNVDEFLRQLNDPFTPPGAKVREYQQGGETYEVYQAPVTQPAMQAYARRMQALPYFFIDAASMMQLEDQKWEIFLIFLRKGGATPGEAAQYTLVGLSTVYKLYRYPDRARWRVGHRRTGAHAFSRVILILTGVPSTCVCAGYANAARQFMVLPPFQKGSHGCLLLETIYRQSALANVVDITVETPAPGMTRLRTVVDCLLCQRHGLLNFTRGSPVPPLDQALIESVQRVLPITPAQVTRVYELMKWRVTNRADEAQFKPFRLEVKGRLARKNEEELGGLNSADRKAKLGVLFQAAEQEWAQIWGSLEKHQGLLG
ncbi:putative histone acetyltransferase type B catalytic subunit [Paratrimastix pyriformis]|uniref:histone acetyltransferase n=1 Tax=Paratrimastix pyriformis TaxID=342808 RepID=A0ABQ8URD5_9EUKA|nr:putative histone acetyltransferase type B catalytic subunit [Paratrimastix pyriformis]